MEESQVMGTTLKIAFAFLLIIHSTEGGGLDEFLGHSSSSGTQNKLQWNVTNSGLPHLPNINGFMGTHGTFRFLSIMEQTAWLVGEPKHGLWRVQDNGMVREFRKKGKIGLRDGSNPNDPNLDSASKDIINNHYSSYISEESWEGYKNANNRISSGDGSYDTQKDFLNYVDLTIYHPKYNGKYDNHVPIDLPLFYCTMSQNEYPYVYNSWKYAVVQPGANKIGPLGIRGGLDIKENYLNVLQFDFIHDAGLWVNVGDNDPNGNDVKMTTNASHIQNVNYQRVDFEEMNVEAYLVERPFFNKPYLFIVAIMENKNGPSEYSFMRNNGPYWDGLVQRNLTSSLKNTVAKHTLKAHVENYPNVGNGSEQTIYGLPVYGTHHPNRAEHKMSGGACPELGGDWATYPWGNAGAGFPTNYQEITPMCDAAVIDMKLAYNLWAESWKDPKLGLANAAFKTDIVEYHVDKSIYGKYTDPYLLANNITNPTMMDLTDDHKIVYESEKSKQNRTIIKLRYTNMGTMIDYNDVKNLRSEKVTCPEPPTCPPTVEPPTCPPVPTCPVPTTDDPVTVPQWGENILIIVGVVLALLVAELIFILVICDRLQRNKVDKQHGKPTENGNTNPTFDGNI